MLVHRVSLGIGSNLGDRRANILGALQRLRAMGRVSAVSSFYEIAAAEGAEGPPFINAAVTLEVEATREDFERRLEEIERTIGRTSTRRLAARPIDIDVLRFDEWEVPELERRAYNLVPLAEIDPSYESRGRSVGAGEIRKLDHGLRFFADRQEEVPEVRIALGRAGVVGVRRVLQVRLDDAPRAITAELSMAAELASDRSGVHMSRLVEALEEAVLDVLARHETPLRADALVESIASQIAQTQGSRSAEVRLRADFSLERWTPTSGKRGEEPYVLLARAHAGVRSRALLGVEVQGMTACPCAQEMIREQSLRDLRDAGVDEETGIRVLEHLPAATHNQRGLGRLLVGTADAAHRTTIRVADLVEIVESSMSSETYDLLKRPDEFFIVNKAHRNPKFVEDVVRGMVARTLETYGEFDDETFVFASQRNEESIHKHDAFAEAYGTFGQFRQELRGAEPEPKTAAAQWLGLQ